MQEPLVLGALAGFGIAIPVGAIAVLIVQTGVRCGFRCAAAAGAGAATADLLYAALAVTAGTTLSAWVVSVQEPLRWGSAVLLTAIAMAGLRQAGNSRGDDRAPQETLLPRQGRRATTYARFLGLTIVNPLTVVYFATIVLGAGLAGELTATKAAMFVLGAFLASLSWQTLLAAIGGIARSKLPPRFHTTLSTGGHLLVLAIAALLLIRS